MIAGSRARQPVNQNEIVKRYVFGHAGGEVDIAARDRRKEDAVNVSEASCSLVFTVVALDVEPCEVP